MTTKTEKKAEPPKQIETNKEQYSCHIILEKTDRLLTKWSRIPI